jgi:hypothetical protein
VQRKSHKFTLKGVCDVIREICCVGAGMVVVPCGTSTLYRIEDGVRKSGSQPC